MTAIDCCYPEVLKHQSSRRLSPLAPASAAARDPASHPDSRLLRVSEKQVYEAHHANNRKNIGTADLRH